MEKLRKELGISLKRLCRRLALSYATLMRWRGRLSKNIPLLQSPGPKKVAPLQIAGLMDAIRALRHGAKRTQGSLALYESYKDQLSRREFIGLVREARQQAKEKRALEMKHLQWLLPGLCWSMDDTRFGLDQEGKKLFLHTVRDLSSKYFLDPIAGDFARGQKVAEHLRYLFDRYGAPLFIKRDNGGNLNHPLVEEVLTEYGVIPLNSPIHYPPYNGSMEKGQDEVKTPLQARLEEDSQLRDRKAFSLHAAAACHEVNHQARRSLKGNVACQVFFSQKGGARFGKRRRRAIFDWIKGLACAILSRMKEDSRRAAQAAWRIAVETWLRQNGYITVTVGREVSPNFLENSYHD